MGRFLGGCAGRLLVLALLAGGVGLAWYNRHELDDLWERVWGESPNVSAELATRADEKLASLGQGGADRVALHEDELQSLIEYRWAGFLPPDVVAPRVRVGAGRVTLEGSVPTARFGRVAELQEIIAFLPDTTALRAVASFVPLDTAHVALEVHELAAAGIPIPKQLVPMLLSRFRGATVPGLPPNALAVPLPPGIGAVYVSGDSMVFQASRQRGE